MKSDFFDRIRWGAEWLRGPQSSLLWNQVADVKRPLAGAMAE